MNKIIKHIVLLAALLLSTSVARAQFLNFRLEIPAGVSYSAQVLDPRTGGTWENNKSKVWIEIQASENISYLLELDFPEKAIQPTPEAFYLNDGSNDFESAPHLREGVQELQMSFPSKLIRNTDPRATFFKAWLGLPKLSEISIRIEYP